MYVNTLTERLYFPIFLKFDINVHLIYTFHFRIDYAYHGINYIYLVVHQQYKTVAATTSI